jgi:hypothetical protein
MSSGSEFEEFARDCVRLARQANSPELREKLFDIAREWMRAAMDGEEADRHGTNVGHARDRNRVLQPNQRTPLAPDHVRDAS